MGKKLIIVESPAKMKTLKKFLGPDYLFASSVGHIRDLPKKNIGIDVEHGFEPSYENLPDKKEVIKQLVSLAKQSELVYLCPDPDREGEAIAWHISNILPKGIPIKRVTFNAITRQAVQEGLAHSRDINYDLVNAQQARRLLDRLVGYMISPLLNRRIQRGRESAVSAGRVQSVALKLVVDREKEIEAFNPVEYWNLAAFFEGHEKGKPFEASLFSVEGKKVEKEVIEGKEVFLIPDEQTATDLVTRVKKDQFHVEKVERKEKKRNPVPPFITSTLQQEASRHYRFSSSRTMSIAQSLYEGVELGEGEQEGLITYMRTDSVRVEPEALKEASEYIRKHFGEDYLPQNQRKFAAKGLAQDAHEAIRPTSVMHTPESIKRYLDQDQYKLYSLIWKRFVASQMRSAVFDTISSDILSTSGLLFRATGSRQKFDGFLRIYEEFRDDDKLPEDEKKWLPNLDQGETLDLNDITSTQSFTKPPPRFSEASLVKELEKSGIGRPSTYSTIMNKIQSRDYTTKEGNRLKPTELGKLIAMMLEGNFEMIMDVNFTAKMEDELEEVAQGDKIWKEVIEEFWKVFDPLMKRAETELYVPKIETKHKCPKCEDGMLQKVWAKSKYFLGCSNYPDCDYRISIEEFEFDKSNYADDFDWDQKCPKCDAEMKVRHGPYGAFLGCTKYPECKGLVSIPKKGEEVINPEDMPKCPAIGCEGRIMARRSRFGKIFYSCSEFPDCDVIVNDLEQLPEKYHDHPKTAYKKPERKKRGRPPKKGAKKKAAPKEKKPRNYPVSDLSPDLQAICGESQLPRTQVMKKVWEYIKEKGLQDASNKRIIKPDASLGKVFGTNEPVEMFQIAKLIGPHMTRKD